MQANNVRRLIFMINLKRTLPKKFGNFPSCVTELRYIVFRFLYSFISAGQKLIIDMWLENSASPLHILHGGFGIGSFIIPLIANPFLAVPAPETELNQSENGNFETTSIITSSTETVYIKESRIEYAYTIAALIVIVVSGVFYFYHCASWRAGHFRKAPSEDMDTKADESGYGKQKHVMTFKEMFNPATCAGGRMLYGITVLLLVCLYFTQAVGSERVGGKFIRAFSIDYHDFSTDDGSYINTVFWIAFSAGRVGGFLAARWIPIRILIMIETGGCLAAAIALAFFGASGPLALWIIMPILGAFIAPLFPSGIGWANYHLEVTGVAITVFLLGGSVGGIVSMKLIGFLYDTYGPKMFLYVLLGQAIAAFAFALIMNIIGARHGNRFNWKAQGKETELDRNEKTMSNDKLE